MARIFSRRFSERHAQAYPTEDEARAAAVLAAAASDLYAEAGEVAMALIRTKNKRTKEST